MLAILLIAVALMILMGDPSVKDVDGMEKLEKIAKGSKSAFTPEQLKKLYPSLSKKQLKDLVKSQSGAPSPWDDLIGWFFWNGGK